jgi:hypothetical protein
MWGRIRMLLVVMIAFVGALVAATAIASSIGSKRFRENYAKEKAELVARARPAPSGVDDAARIAALPAPVRRYLEGARATALPALGIATLAQRGSLRAATDKPWMPFEAEQVYSLDPPGFVWLARARVIPFVHILAHDAFAGGAGNMKISLLGIFTVADARGPEIDQGAALRYWGEIIAFPEAVLGSSLRWEPIDVHRAALIVGHAGAELRAEIDFDEQARPIAMHAQRYRDVDGKSVLTPWSGHFRDWRELDGRMFPTRWESVWHLPEGDFSAVKIEVLSLRTGAPSTPDGARSGAAPSR